MLPAALLALRVLAPFAPQDPAPPPAGGVTLHRAESRTVPSPDGRARLSVRRGAVRLQVPGRPARSLLRLRRSGAALWSPDGRRLALNDELGSNVARAFLFDGATGRRLADLEAELDRRFPEDVWNGHHYVRAEAWWDATTLDVLVEGHADASRTALRMRYRRAGDGAWTRLLRQRQAAGTVAYTDFTEPCPRD